MSEYNKAEYASLKELIVYVTQQVDDEDKIAFWEDVVEGVHPLLVEALKRQHPPIITEKIWFDEFKS